MTALKTIAARIRGSKTDLDELGEDTSDLVEGFSKYADELQALTGFDIRLDGMENQFKNLYEIFDGIAKVWDRLSDTQQARVAEILGGTRQLQVISSIFSNWSDSVNAYTDAMNSAGVATEANATYMESIEGHLGVLKATWQEFASSTVTRDTVNQVVDLGTSLVEHVLTPIGEIVEKVGVLNVALAGIGAKVFVKASGGFDSAFKKLKTGMSAVVSEVETFMATFAQIYQVNRVDNLTGLQNGLNVLQAGFKGLMGAITGASAAMQVFLGVIAAFAIIKGISALIDHFTTSFEEAAETANASVAEYEEAKSQVESTNSQLEETKTKLDELKAKGSLTLVEQEDYDRLCDQTKQLERQLESQKQLAEYEGRIAMGDIAAAMRNDNAKYDYLIEDDNGTRVDDLVFDAGRDTPINAYIEQTKTLNTLTEEYQQTLDKIDALQLDILDTQTQITEIENDTTKSKSEKKNETKDLKAELKQQKDQQTILTRTKDNLDIEIREVTAKSEELYNTLYGWVPTLEEFQDSDMFPEAGEWLDQIETAFDNAYEAAKSSQEKIDEALSGYDVSGTVAAIEQVAKAQNGITTNELQSLMETYPELGDVIQQTCTEAGVTIEDFVNTINSKAGVLDLDEVKTQMHDAFAGAVDQGIIDDTLASWDSFWNSLTEEQQRSVYEISRTNDTSKWGLDQWQEKLRDSSTSIAGATEQLEAYHNVLANLETAVTSETGITPAMMDATGMDAYAAALEEVNGEYQFNLELVREIAEANRDAQKQQFLDVKNTKLEERAALEKDLQDARMRILQATTPTSRAVAQQDMDNITVQIDLANQAIRDQELAIAAVDQEFTATMEKIFGAETTFAQNPLFKDQVDDVQAFAKAIGGLSVEEFASQFPELASQIEGSGESLQDFVDDINSAAEVMDASSLTERIIDELEGFDKYSPKAQENLRENITAQLDAGGQEVIKAMSEYMDAYDTMGWSTDQYIAKIQELAQANEEAQRSFENVSENVNQFSSNLSTIQDAMTGGAVSADMFNTPGMSDYSVALERVNGEYQLNEELVDAITEAKREELQANIDLSKQSISKEYQKNAKNIQTLRKEMKSLSGDQKKAHQAQIDSLLAENDTLATQISQFNLLSDSMNDTYSLYTDWMNTKGTDKQGEMFDGVTEAVELVNDVLNDVESEDYMKIGTADYKSALQLLGIDPNLSEGEIRDYFNSLSKYWIQGEEGFTGMLDIQRVYDTLDIGGFLDETAKAEGRYVIKNGTNLEEIAEHFGTTKDVIKSFFDTINQYLADEDKIHYEDPVKQSIDELGVSANQAKEQFAFLAGSTDEWAQKLSQLDFSNIDDVDKNIEAVKDAMSNMDVDTAAFDQLKKALHDLIVMKIDASTPITATINTSGFDTNYQHVLGLLAQLEEAQQRLSGLKDTAEQYPDIDLTADIQLQENAISNIKNELQNGLTEEEKQVLVDVVPNNDKDFAQTLQDLLDEQSGTLHATVELIPRIKGAADATQGVAEEAATTTDIPARFHPVDTTEVEDAITEPMDMPVKTGDVDHTSVDNYEPEEKTINVVAETEAAEKQIDGLTKTRYGKAEFRADMSRVNRELNKLNNIKKTITFQYRSTGSIPTGGSSGGSKGGTTGRNGQTNLPQVTGNAYAKGSANAEGKWGTQQAGRYLMGELGREDLRRHTVMCV